MSITLADFEAVLPVLIVLGGALSVLLVDLFVRGERSKMMMEMTAYAALLAAILVTVFYRFPAKAEWWFGGAVREDMLGRLVNMAVLAATVLLVLLSSRTTRERKIRQAEYLALVMFATAGMMILAVSADLISIFICIELMSLAIYVLCGMARTDARANEASIKYFVNGSFASAFLLFGMTLIYGSTGTVFLAEMTAGDPTLAILGMTLMLVGFAFKVGAVPFHFWVPDVYEGAPTAITAYMSVAVKAAGFAALMRIVMTVFPNAPGIWAGPLWYVAILTMVVGNVMAVVQTSVKRMLAYSSIAHSGYALVGVISGAVDATIFYLFVYTFMTFGAFTFLSLITRRGREAEHYDDYLGLFQKRPWSAAAMTLFMISLAGLPPTAGFFGKFTLFGQAVRAGHIDLVVIGVVTSAISLFYYLRVVVNMYMKEPHPDEPDPEPADQGALIVVMVTSAFVLLLGVAPTTYLNYAARAVFP